MHCTNTFPLISPAAYYAAHHLGMTVVQSLHNYRLLCSNAIFLRNRRVCEDCLRKPFPWPAVLYRCYRGKHAASAVVAITQVLQRVMRNFSPPVDTYIALTEFSRQKFVQGGLPFEKIAVKPNFVHPDPGPGTGIGGYALFVGRLSPEKGIEIMLSAWSLLPTQMKLMIIGDGPLAPKVRQSVEDDNRIVWLGRRTPEEVFSIVGDAAFLILPSIWYEGLPKTLLEAFAKGTPVIASKIGSLAKLVGDGMTGLHIKPGNANDLASKVCYLHDNPKELARMRNNARQIYKLKYTAEVNYRILMKIYEQALSGAMLPT